MVGQAGLLENADARSEEAQQRRHQNGQGSQMAASTGGVAESKAEVHLSKVEDLGTFAAFGTEGTTRAGETTGDDTRAGEETVPFGVVDRGT